MLENDEELSPAQNIIPILREQNTTPKIEEALDELSATLRTDNLKRLNKMVEVDKADPEEVATEYLQEKGLIE